MENSNKKLRKFSTQNADYFLNPGVHDLKTNGNGIEKYDAIIMETGFDQYADIHLSDLRTDNQYSKIIQNNLALKESKPIFYVDIPAKEVFRKKEEGHDEATDIEAELITIPFMFSIFSSFINPLSSVFMLPAVSAISDYLHRGKNKYFDNVLSYSTLSHFYTPSGFRSAASARKIDEFIAPEIEKRIERKPNIFIDFGAGHGDLEPYLKHKKIRDFVISFYQKFYEKSKFDTLDLSYMNKVCEIRFRNFVSPKANNKIIKKENEPFFANWERIYYKI